MPAVQERDPGEPSTTTESWLDRRLDLTRVEPAVIVFLVLLVVAAMLRFWDLGARAMHYDEAVHALTSWQFYTGERLYQYNPSTHGPLLYHLTALSYFLFGDSEAAARAPEALFGVLLVFLCYPLRRWLGRYGWLIAAGLVTFSPAFTYFARFARHDALVATLTLAAALFLLRFVEERRPRDLALAAAALGLSAASHELTLITVFVLFSFLGLAYLLDRQGQRSLARARIAAAIALVLGLSFGLALSALDGWPLLQVLTFGIVLLALGYLGLSFLWERLYRAAPSPVLSAVQDLARERRSWLTALGVFGVIFGLLFTTFLTYPRGLLDGLIHGLIYWIGQQPVARGNQPWFYYLMLLGLYERLALLAGGGGLVIVLMGILRRGRRAKEPSEPAPAEPPAQWPFFQVFLAYWALMALTVFSWAGEKMPWLLLHVALPLVLLAALALDRFGEWLRRSWRDFWRSMDWLIGPLFLLLILAVAGLAGAASGQGQPLAEQYLPAQVAVLGLIAVGLIALLVWRISAAEGRHIGQSISALLIVLLAAYGVRSTFLVNFYYADNPREMLVYTQTAPDVPLVVRQIEQLSVDQTRKVRTVADPTGGHGLQVAVDVAGDDGLRVPFDWYLRAFARAGTLTYFNSAMEAPPGTSDIVLVAAENEPAVRPYLQGRYTGMKVKLQWWFPEEATYRRWTLFEVGTTPAGYPTIPLLNPAAYTREGFNNLIVYQAFRQLPALYGLPGRDFYYYVRSELLPAGGVSGPPDPYIEKLTPRPARRSLGTYGSGEGQLAYPRGLVVDAFGNIFVADSGNNRIMRFDAAGQATSWGSVCILESGAGCIDPDGTGPLPLGAGQFYEPWGVTVDAQGRVYVADTWNHRIQVFDNQGRFLGQWGEGRLVDAELDVRGRAGTPYAFYGPRGVAVDSQGRVYVTDTGNERVLVYAVQEGADGYLQANFLYQWGTLGPEPGHFVEPVGIAVDAADRVYVADTLNGRIQVFAPDGSGQVSFTPVVTWKVTGWDSTSRENKPYIAVSPGGQVYFAVPERHYVVGTDGVGNILAVWGGYGGDLASFNLPVGVAVDAQGLVYVSDSGNGRVLVFAVP